MTHDRLGLETQRTTGEISSQFEYDAMGRLLHQYAGNSHAQLLERKYRYDKAGNLRQVDDLTDGRMKFHYDALDRLQKVETSLTSDSKDNNVTPFTVDPAGNLLDTQYPEPEGFVQGNRLRVFQNYRFEYDDVGNLVRQFQGKLETRLYYNVANQLVRVHKNAQVFEYAYDPLGRRIKKQCPWGETRFLWDGDRLLCEQFNKHNEARPEEQAEETPEQPLDDEQVIYIHTPGHSIPVCQIRDGEVYYFHTDQQGTPHIISDSHGEAVWQASYKVHGAIAQLQRDDIDNPIHFHAHYYDAETGLLYGRLRYYHPIIGRFVQQNPRGLLSGSNLYLYHLNHLYHGAPIALATPASPVPQPAPGEHFVSPANSLDDTLASPITPSAHLPIPGDNHQPQALNTHIAGISASGLNLIPKLTKNA